VKWIAEHEHISPRQVQRIMARYREAGVGGTPMATEALRASLSVFDQCLDGEADPMAKLEILRRQCDLLRVAGLFSPRLGEALVAESRASRDEEIDRVRATNVRLREFLGQHGLSDEVIDQATEIVIEADIVQA
jgi:hypothetical protein